MAVGDAPHDRQSQSAAVHLRAGQGTPCRLTSPKSFGVRAATSRAESRSARNTRLMLHQMTNVAKATSSAPSTAILFRPGTDLCQPLCEQYGRAQVVVVGERGFLMM